MIEKTIQSQNRPLIFLAEIAGKSTNIAWLYGKVRAGYTVIDIGIDICRTRRSSSYIVEQIVLSCWQYRNAFKMMYHVWDGEVDEQ